MSHKITEGSVSAGADLNESNVITGDQNRIRRGDDHTQNVTLLADRDVIALLHSVEREIQVIHREIVVVKTQLQNAVFVGLFIFLIIVGVAIFVGDRQISGLSQRLHDVELQMQKIERRLSQDSMPYHQYGAP